MTLVRSSITWRDTWPGTAEPNRAHHQRQRPLVRVAIGSLVVANIVAALPGLAASRPSTALLLRTE
jgi:hypothetical protein